MSAKRQNSSPQSPRGEDEWDRRSGRLLELALFFRADAQVGVG